jgi:hypothetical protein
MSSAKSMNKAYRNGWILVLAIAVFVVVFFVFVLRTNENSPAPAWDMGGESFVPASSNHANGYYSPVEDAAKGGQQ